MPDRRHRLPAYMTDHPRNVLREITAERDRPTRQETMLALAYHQAAMAERGLTEEHLRKGKGSYRRRLPFGELYVEAELSVYDPRADAPPPGERILSARDQEFVNLAGAAIANIHALRNFQGKLDSLEALTHELMRIKST